MDQPIEDRINKLEEEVRLLRQQITEPIRIDRLEIDRGGTQELLKETNKKLDQIIQTQTDRSERFDTLEHGIQELKQELNTHAEAWLNTLQEHYTEHKHDIANVQTVLRGHAKFFEEHGKRLAATATKDDIAAMATKEDLAQLRSDMATKADIVALKDTQERQRLLLQAILDRLPEKS
jgi:protoporphyrinogen oxidase